MENLKTSTKKKTGYQVFFSRRYLELNSIHPTTTPPLTFTELSKYISQEWNQLSNDQKLDFHNLSSSVDNGINNRINSNDCLELSEETTTVTLPRITSRREELMQMCVKPDLYKLCEMYKLTKTGNKSTIVEKILEREEELVRDGVKNKDNNSNEKDEKDKIEIVESKENEEKEIFTCLKQHLYNKLRTKNRLLSSQNHNPLFSSNSTNSSGLSGLSDINHSKIKRLHIPRLHINTVPFQPSSLSILLQEAVNDSVQNNHSGNPGFSKTVVRRLEKGGIDHIHNIDHTDQIDEIDQIGCDHDEHDEHDIYVGLVEEEDGIDGIVGIKKKKILPEEGELVEDPDGGDEDPDDPEGGDPDDRDPEDEDPENEDDDDDPDNEDDDLGELEDPEDVPIEDDDLEMIPETEDVFM
jgi:succinate dehydrogenase flavin-adding protein (antitoxin of CptAB toxin-antitoxin module)